MIKKSLSEKDNCGVFQISTFICCFKCSKLSKVSQIQKQQMKADLWLARDPTCKPSATIFFFVFGGGTRIHSGLSGALTAQILTNNYVKFKKRFPKPGALCELYVWKERLLTVIQLHAEQQITSTRDSHDISRVRGVTFEHERFFHTYLTRRPAKTSPPPRKLLKRLFLYHFVFHIAKCQQQNTVLLFISFHELSYNLR